MKQNALKSMSTDKLWMLREKIAATLSAKIVAEKEVLEERLRLLKRVRVEQIVRTAARRPYQLFFRKSEIRRSRRKRGPVAGSRHGLTAQLRETDRRFSNQLRGGISGGQFSLRPASAL
jgi:hypothetical protein